MVTLPSAHAVRLEPLEDLLGVVQHGAGRVHRDGRPRLDARVVPALAVGVADRDHVVGEDPPEPGFGQQRVALGGGYRCRIRTNLEVEVVTAVHDGPPGSAESWAA